MRYLIAFTFIFLLSKFHSYGQNEKDSSFTWNTIDRNNYSIKFPGTWTLDTSHQFGADIFILSPKNADTDIFRENVNVMIQNLSGTGLTLDSYAEISIKQVKAMLNDANILETRRTKVDGKEFHMLLFTGQQGIFKLKTLQIFLIENDSAYVITLTTELHQYDNYNQVGETILNSFRLK